MWHGQQDGVPGDDGGWFGVPLKRLAQRRAPDLSSVRCRERHQRRALVGHEPCEAVYECRDAAGQADLVPPPDAAAGLPTALMNDGSSSAQAAEWRARERPRVTAEAPGVVVSASRDGDRVPAREGGT